MRMESLFNINLPCEWWIRRILTSNAVPTSSTRENIIKIYRGATVKQNLLVSWRGNKWTKAKMRNWKRTWTICLLKKDLELAKSEHCFYSPELLGFFSQNSVTKTITRVLLWKWKTYCSCVVHARIACIRFPVPDPKRPWGFENCNKCGGVCYVHYFTIEEVLALNNGQSQKWLQFPS